MAFRRTLFALLLLWIHSFFLISFPLLAQESTPKEESKPTFYTQKITAQVGHPQMIPFQLSTPARQTQEFSIEISSSEHLEILLPPKILEGKQIGYFRVYPKKEGKIQLQLEKNATLQFVIQGTSQPPTPPQIISPASGACVWGTVAFGVEQWIDPIRHPFPLKSLKIQFSNGQEFVPKQQERIHDGPLQKSLFEIDVSKLPTGENSLIAIAEYENDTLKSNPLSIWILHPSPETILHGECEDHLLDEPRPDYIGKTPPTVGFQQEASNKGFILNYGAYPAWGNYFSILEEGWYQMIVRARGDQAAGAYPSIGLYQNSLDRPLTASRLIHKDWHRIPVGHPVYLKAGKNHLTVFFMNDFYIPQMADRNLFLDCYELAQVPFFGSKQTASNSEGMMSMTQGFAPFQKKLRIGFDHVLHNQIATGVLTVQGHCAWENDDKTKAPYVTLYVNNIPALTQQSPDPFFLLDKSHLYEGENVLQLKATLPSGETTWTKNQTIHNPEFNLHRDPPQQYYRFSILSDGWEPSIQEVIRLDRDKEWWHPIVALYSNREMVYHLPEQIQGNFEVFVEACGTEFMGLPQVHASLSQAKQTQEIGNGAVQNWWSPVKVGTIQLEAGAKDLIVAFKTDLCIPNVGDRNLWIKAVRLVEVLPQADRIAPRVFIDYPKASPHLAYQADAVVATVYDDRSISYSDLIIDGEPQKMNIAPPNGRGKLVFPLLLRNLTPGDHRLKIRVYDPTGNMGESPEITIKVLADPPSELLPYARAVHLLNRLAYGPDPVALADILTLGEEVWLEESLTRSFHRDEEQVAIENAYWIYPQDGDEYHVTQRVLRHLLTTQNPLRTRFVLWTQNHFSTWIKKTGSGSKWQEHLLFSQLGVASFPELLYASATSPAMLFYLDQQSSVAAQLNENYAREILELHTLSVKGGYTQTDVTTLAALLNGWTVSEETDCQGNGFPIERVFRFDPHLNHGRNHTILGFQFTSAPPEERYERIRMALEILAAHPNTATFIAHKFAQHYVSATPPESLVLDLTRVFQENNGDMKQLFRTLIQHPAFWKSPPRLSTPLDFCTRILRAGRSQEDWIMGECLRSSGLQIFDRSSPDGYPEENEAYADSNVLLQRWKFVQRAQWILTEMVPWEWRERTETDVQKQQEKIMDILSIRITGFPLQETSLQVGAILMQEAQKNKERPYALLGRLPEINLR